MPGSYKQRNQIFQKSVPSSLGCDRPSLRSFYNRKSAHLPFSLKQKKQKQIIQLLEKLPFWKRAGFIAVYKALKDEPGLSSFYSYWGDKICFPVIHGEILEFYKGTRLWRKNSLSVLEPVPVIQNKIPLDKISVFLIPGRVFDRRGGRMGRGQGYYDKTLAKLSGSLRKKALFVGVAWAEQIHDRPLSLFPHDILLDVLVTDQFALFPLGRGRANFKGMVWK